MRKLPRNYNADHVPVLKGMNSLGEQMAAYDALPKVVREELGQCLLPYNVPEILHALKFEGYSVMEVLEQLWGVNQRNNERLAKQIGWPKQKVEPIEAKHISQATMKARRLKLLMDKRLSRSGRAPVSSAPASAAPREHTQPQTPSKLAPFRVVLR